MKEKKICENNACQYENDANTNFCVQCGALFTTNGASTSTPVPATLLGTEVCEHENNGNGKFCIKCGEPFVNDLEPSATATNHEPKGSDQVPPIQKKKSPSFLNKKLLIMLGALLVVLFGSYWILEKTFSNKDSLIATLEQVVVSDDADKFYEALTINDASDVEKKAYKQYLKENDVSEIANTLVKSISVLHESDQLLTQVATEDSEVDQFKVIKIKKFGLFNSYEIQPIKFKVFAETNSNAIEVSIDGQNKRLSTDESVSISKYLPGKYPYTVLWETEIGSVTVERQVDIWPSESNVLDGSLPMYEVDLIDGPYDEWNYLINGKQLNLKKYIVDGRFVVPEGVEFKLVATFKENGVLYESEPVQINGSAYPEFSFLKYEQKLELEAAKQELEREKEYAKQVAESEISSLIQNYLTIYSYGYVDALNTVISTDSAFYAQQAKYLQSLLDKNTQAEIDEYDIVSVQENGGGSYTVTVDELYTIIKPDANPKEVKQKSIYTVKLIDGEYLITGLKLGQ
ncbi:TcaA NTF2-like domain-containing protein [Lysinibacillus sp. 54212]|uniref:TcaA NTF2-like domain-containing protein n=1 Tax=Lysinibacillus sp. 54212 TaxID=3119829 RepID=UPI002FC637A0